MDKADETFGQFTSGMRQTGDFIVWVFTHATEIWQWPVIVIALLVALIIWGEMRRRRKPRPGQGAGRHFSSSQEQAARDD